MADTSQRNISKSVVVTGGGRRLGLAMAIRCLRMGFEVIIFLIVFAGLLYFTKKRIWAGVAGH